MLVSAVDRDGNAIEAIETDEPTSENPYFQGGPSPTQLDGSEANMPVRLKTSEPEVLFEPTTDDTVGTYTYELYWFWGGSANPEYYLKST